jgi:hypothetical protein
MCDAGETPQSCPVDCPANPCGDGTCAADESPQSCAVDCKVLLDECNQNCDAYDFFMCFQPGDLQTCYDACEAATSSQLKQFNNCAATATTSCDLTCFDFL